MPRVTMTTKQDPTDEAAKRVAKVLGGSVEILELPVKEFIYAEVKTRLIPEFSAWATRPKK